MIEEIKDKQSKSQIARSILETLTDWFGITESREQYIKNCAEHIFVVAKEAQKEIGFIFSLPVIYLLKLARKLSYSCSNCFP